MERFWSKVNKTDYCWEWIAGKNSHGYGVFHYQGRPITASRMAWFITYGVWPTQWVLHTCDNPACVNPDHLYEGSRLDNARDAIERNRYNPKPTNLGKFGEQSHRSFLTKEIVKQIKERLAEGQSQEKIAATYDISQSHVSRIKLGMVWNDVE